jgi:hypothetical protein
MAGHYLFSIGGVATLIRMLMPGGPGVRRYTTSEAHRYKVLSKSTKSLQSSSSRHSYPLLSHNHDSSGRELTGSTL